MINLLPPDKADHIRYGRFNSSIRRWLIITWLAIIGLVVIIGSGSLYIKNQSNNLQDNIDSLNQQLQNQNLAQVQKDAAEISGDVKVINQVLNQEVRFSDLMQQIGKVMPPGTVLSALTLGKVSGALDLSANAKDYTSAAQIAINLGGSATSQTSANSKDELFSRVDIINVTCSNDGSTYPCTATFRALFSTTAQAEFLGVAKGGS